MLNHLRTRLAALDALPHLSFLAIWVGVLASVVAIALRELVEQAQRSLLPGGQVEHYENLPPLFIFLLPTLGGLLLAIIWHHLRPAQRPTGIVHVIERLAYHQGYLPAVNALMQFVGAAICLISGHSVGREGPSVHLGAASGSLLGQWLKLPNNSLRTLIACGTAAAIAASFNTPLAGVIFAMEVVLLEYSVIGFTPVILAAVIGAMVTRAWYGNTPAFDVPNLNLSNPLEELLLLPLMGVFIGILAALFIHLLQMISRQAQPMPIGPRLVLAGLLTGLMGLLLPEVMGIGYDTVSTALTGELSLTLALGLVLGKLLITAVGLGLGLPGGVIGPTLVMGAAAGHLMGYFAQYWLPAGHVSSLGFYSMLGMGAMMSAVLQAPLAGLTALLELTGNLNLIVPGMFVIVVANLVAHSPPFGKNSLFIEQMRARGLDYAHNPIAQSLRRVGVIYAMDRRFTTAQQAQMSGSTAEWVLSRKPHWIIVEAESQAWVLVRAADVARALSELGVPDEATDTVATLDLLAIPAQRLQVALIDRRATLQEALAQMQQQDLAALVVVAGLAPPYQFQGIVTREAIEHNYLGFKNTQ